jgi:hypothetical protein
MAELEQLNQLKEQGILSEEEHPQRSSRFWAFRLLGEHGS